MEKFPDVKHLAEERGRNPFLIALHRAAVLMPFSDRI